MNAEQFRRVEQLFGEACELSKELQAAFLERACADDPIVRQEVEAMLAADDEDLSVAAPAWNGLLPTAIGSASSEQQAQSLPEQVGRYRVLRQHGRGGMGVVYEAEQESPHRRVALKVLNTGVVSAEHVARFRHEVEILGQLDHPGIARIYEAGSIEAIHGGQPYFTMEFIEGEELLDHASSQHLDDAARLRLFARICDAVQYAHQKGVIHRDLKPQNILVTSSTPAPSSGATDGVTGASDTAGQPKILDFGVARTADASSDQSMLTRAGQLIGTLAYMSPEQARGDSRSLDTRSDVYSLGVVLFQLLTGKLPHELQHRSMAESVRIIQEDEPRRIAAMHDRYRGDLDAIVGRCLEKEPQRRYRSAADLAEDVRRHLRNEPIHARPPGTLELVRKFALRNRALVGGVAATFLAVIAGLVATTIFAIRADNNATRARSSEARARQSEAQALRQSYVSGLIAASALSRDDPQRAAAILQALPSELRGWEWRHLSSRLERASRIYRADSKTVGSYAFSHDGKRLISALEDGHIAVWDALDTRLLTLGTDLLGAEIHEIAASPTAPVRVACGTSDGRVRLWNLDENTWSEVSSTPGPILDLAWDADGSRLLVATSTSIRLWKDGRIVRDHPFEPARGGLSQLGFSADGRAFACWASLDPQDPARGPRLDSVGIWDAATGELHVNLDAFAWGIPTDLGIHAVLPSFGLSHDGTRIATQGGSQDVRICAVDESAQGDPVKWVTSNTHLHLRGHRHGVWTLAWTPDDERLVSAAADGTIRLWHPSTGAMLDVLQFEVHAIDGRIRPQFAIAPDGSGLAYRKDGFPAFWDFSPVSSTVLHPDVNYVYYHTYSRDGTRLAVASYYSRNLTIIDTFEHRVTDRMEAVKSPSRDLVVGVVFPPGQVDGASAQVIRQNASPRFDRTLDRLPREDRRGLRTAPGTVVSHDGRLLATAGQDRNHGPLVVSDLSTGEKHLEVQGPYWGVAFSPDGRMVAAGREWPGEVELWDLGTRQKLRALSGHDSHTYCVDFHPDGSRLASGGNDGAIRLWDTTTWDQVHEIRGHESYVFSLSFSPDGEQLTSGSGDYTLRIWDTIPRTERHEQSLRRGR